MAAEPSDYALVAEVGRVYSGVMIAAPPVWPLLEGYPVGRISELPGDLGTR